MSSFGREKVNEDIVDLSGGPSKEELKAAKKAKAEEAKAARRAAKSSAKDGGGGKKEAAAPSETKDRAAAAAATDDTAAARGGAALAGAMEGLELTEEQKRVAKGRAVTGVLASTPAARDVKFESFSVMLGGNLLVQDCPLELNQGCRYGLIGENGSGEFERARAARGARGRYFLVVKHGDSLSLRATHAAHLDRQVERARGDRAARRAAAGPHRRLPPARGGARARARSIVFVLFFDTPPARPVGGGGWHHRAVGAAASLVTVGSR